ncbi:NADPH:quinone oxidoreductase family protein [Streptomyces spongiae]|uniref:NADPH:quinone oxidoreductase family protein n=2 Tax=Streptomyces spongiae TaxID=565072 RepID=A0A5N8XJ95_9ACTN|nr:NADPH:quinone oxidoreductase family protein [Streptomyces spongiae]
MRAALVTAYEGPAALVVREVGEPEHDADAVRISVHAAGITFPDLLATRGLYQVKPPLPFAPGLEVAGIVLDAPDGSAFAPGDRVAAFLTFGGLAEVVSVDPAHVVPLPDEVGFVDGAALVVNHLTAHFALTKRGELRPGQTVLVHGAAGGLGTASVQVARACGAEVIAVASSDVKARLARDCGAHEVVSPGGFLDAVRRLTGGRGVDIVVDPVGGDRVTDSLRALAPEGRLLVLGFASGEIASVRTNRLLLGNSGVLGVAWAEYVRLRPAYFAEQWADLLPRIVSGQLQPMVRTTYPLAEAADALRAIETRTAIGKLVIDLT